MNTDIQPYDSIAAHTIEAGDQILIGEDNLIEVKSVSDEGEFIVVTGFSHDTGDSETYEFEPFAMVSVGYL